MIDKKKLEHLHCAFPKLTETNQVYVLGLAEGLMHAQDVCKKTPLVKVPTDSQESKSVFYNCSEGRKTCS